MVDNIVLKSLGLVLIITAHMVFNGKLSFFLVVDGLRFCGFSPARGSFLLVSLTCFLVFFLRSDVKVIACSHNTCYYAANDAPVSTPSWFVPLFNSLVTVLLRQGVVRVVSFIVLALHIENIKITSS